MSRKVIKEMTKIMKKVIHEGKKNKLSKEQVMINAAEEFKAVLLNDPDFKDKNVNELLEETKQFFIKRMN